MSSVGVCRRSLDLIWGEVSHQRAEGEAADVGRGCFHTALSHYHKPVDTFTWRIDFRCRVNSKHRVWGHGVDACVHVPSQSRPPVRCDGLWPPLCFSAHVLSNDFHPSDWKLEWNGLTSTRKLVGEEPDWWSRLMWELQSGEEFKDGVRLCCCLKTVNGQRRCCEVCKGQTKKKKCLIPNFPWRRNSWIYFLLCFLLELNLLSKSANQITCLEVNISQHPLLWGVDSFYLTPLCWWRRVLQGFVKWRFTEVSFKTSFLDINYASSK